MDRLDRISAWTIFGIGVLHCAVTFAIFSAPSDNAMWFFSGGLALIYAAALNLLRARYAAAAPGMRFVCVAVNVSLLAFILAYAVSKGVRIFRNPGAVVLVACSAAVTLFSLLRRSTAEKHQN